MGNVNGMTPQEAAARAKEDSFTLAALPGEKRDAALTAIAEALEAEKAALFAANGQDLKFDDHKLDSCLAGIRDLIAMDDPAGKSVFKRQLSDGLVLEKVTCPIGVIGVIFESRPDALVQILALCLKSGNGNNGLGNRCLRIVKQQVGPGVSVGLPVADGKSYGIEFSLCYLHYIAALINGAYVYRYTFCRGICPAHRVP